MIELSGHFFPFLQVRGASQQFRQRANRANILRHAAHVDRQSTLLDLGLASNWRSTGGPPDLCHNINIEIGENLAVDVNQGGVEANMGWPLLSDSERFFTNEILALDAKLRPDPRANSQFPKLFGENLLANRRLVEGQHLLQLVQ